MSRMYVLVNKDLKMSTGKTAAQVAHAVARLGAETPDSVIVLQATGEQIKNLERYLDKEGVETSLYIDEGVNEVAPYSVTALAVEPLHYSDQWDIFKNLNLLKGRLCRR